MLGVRKWKLSIGTTISSTTSGPQEKGDGQTFQVSSGSIFKRTCGHFHAFLSPEYAVHPLESDFERPLLPDISWGIFIFSFTFVIGEREGNASLQLPPILWISSRNLPPNWYPQTPWCTFNAHKNVCVVFHFSTTVEISSVCFTNVNSRDSGNPTSNWDSSKQSRRYGET